MMRTIISSVGTTRQISPAVSSQCFLLRVAMLVCVLLSTLRTTTVAFVVPSTSPSTKRIIPTTTVVIQHETPTVAVRPFTSTQPFLTLDDSWDDVAELINQAAAASNIQWSAIERQLTALQWKQFLSKEWFLHILDTATQLQTYWQTAVPTQVKMAAAVTIPLFVLTSTVYNLSFPNPDYRANMEPYVRGKYDPIQAQAYYAKHPFLVAQRLAQLLRVSNRFLWNLLIDKYILRREEQMRPIRAQELLQLITQLGPTAIKVGQALSVRPDLIPAEYATSLSSLQDQVPPFDGTKAKAVLQEQLGMERYQHFKGLGLDAGGGGGGGRQVVGPVASASIGQVYKGVLQRNNDSDDTVKVAVKIQRPNVLAEIALDLYIVREFAPLYQKFSGSGADLQGLANEWGRVFISELDYRLEAANTVRFNQEMQKRNLNAVCAPNVLSDYSTEQVLVTEWVDGTRIDQSNAEDIPRLCSVALNAYLVMLLELQSLHCDPHPGNLLRTPDGRLCILDFGMTLDIDPDLQYSLLEYVAHLTGDNFDTLPEDLVKIGFLKAEKLDFARRSGVLEPLKYFLRQAGKGGGAKGVRDRVFDDYRAKFPGKTDDELRMEMRAEMKQNLADIVERESLATGITLEVEELQKQNRDAFQIPEWFLYTSRAFLTLEGVSLQADENYSIIKNCFPYIAKRLVADEDPRARKALRDLIYGASDLIDVDRLSELAEGFSSYTTTTKTVTKQNKDNEKEGAVPPELHRKRKIADTESSITLVKDSADILLAPEGNLVQNLLVEESALAASARFKDTFRNTFVDGPKRFRESLPLGVGSFLPPLPFELRVEPFLRKTEAELRAQALADKISSLVLKGANTPENVNGALVRQIGPTPEARTAFGENLRDLDPEQAAIALKEIRENLPRYAPLIGQLGGKFLSTLLKTANMNIENSLLELEKSGENTDPILRSAAKGLSSIAERGAKAFSSEDSR